MASTTRFLSPYPPTLLAASERQAFSGSSASFSSSSSSTSGSSDQRSRGSSASGYLTDITPPPTPSRSRIDSGEDASFAAKPILSLPISHDHPSEQCPTSKDGRHVFLRSVIAVEDEEGYGSDYEADSIPFDAVEVIRAKLMRAKPSINTRRALRIMQRHGAAGSNAQDLDDDNLVETPVMPMKVVVTEVADQETEDWSQEFEMGVLENIQVRPSTESEGTMAECRGLDIPAMAASTVLEAPNDVCALATQLGQSEPVLIAMPATPIIEPIGADWSHDDCSPFMLCSPSFASTFSSSISISRLILSPLNDQPEHVITHSSPAIYNDSLVHGRSPLDSPTLAISACMFSSHHQTMPAPLTGSNMDIASLMRLEVAASLRRPITGVQLAPEPRPLIGLGFASLSQFSRLPPDSDSSFSFYDDSFETDYELDSSFAARELVAAQFPQTPVIPHKSSLPAQGARGAPDQHNQNEDEVRFEMSLENDAIQRPIMGLGLGYLAESSLCSSSSVSLFESISLLSVADGSRDHDVRDSPRALPSTSVDANCCTEGKSPLSPAQQLIASPSLELLPNQFSTCLANSKPRKRLPHPHPHDSIQTGEQRHHTNHNPAVEPIYAPLEQNTTDYKTPAIEHDALEDKHAHWSGFTSTTIPTAVAECIGLPQPQPSFHPYRDPKPHIPQPSRNESTITNSTIRSDTITTSTTQTGYIQKTLTAEHLALLDKYSEIYPHSPYPPFPIVGDDVDVDPRNIKPQHESPAMERNQYLDGLGPVLVEEKNTCGHRFYDYPRLLPARAPMSTGDAWQKSRDAKDAIRSWRAEAAAEIDCGWLPLSPILESDAFFYGQNDALFSIPITPQDKLQVAVDVGALDYPERSSLTPEPTTVDQQVGGAEQNLVHVPYKSITPGHPVPTNCVAKSDMDCGHQEPPALTKSVIKDGIQYGYQHPPTTKSVTKVDIQCRYRKPHSHHPHHPAHLDAGAHLPSNTPLDVPRDEHVLVGRRMALLSSSLAKSTSSPRRDQPESSLPSGVSPTYSLTPETDPRSPCPCSCSPLPDSAIDYFHKDSWILGADSVLPDSSSSSSFDHGSIPGLKHKKIPQPPAPAASFIAQENCASALASSSVDDDNSVPASVLPSADSTILRESKSAEGLGIGLPSDLASRPLRQRDDPMSASSGSAIADGFALEGLPSVESCLDLAQLAAAFSPHKSSNGDTLSSLGATTSRPQHPDLQAESSGSNSRSKPLFKVPRFAKRCLYVIPEQPTPSPTSIHSSGRLSRWRSPTWLPSFNSSTPRTASSGTVTSATGNQDGVSVQVSVTETTTTPNLNSAPVNVNLGPSTDDSNPNLNSMTRNLLRKCFSRIPRTPTVSSASPPLTSASSPDSAASSSPSSFPQTNCNPPPLTMVLSPGVIEHLDAPRGLGIFNKRRRPYNHTSLPASTTGTRGEGRFSIKPSSWGFHVLF